MTLAPPLGLRRPHSPLRGRGTLLRRLDEALRPGLVERRIHVLCGMGGCGKTSVALELASRRVAARLAVWWIDARQDATLEAGLRAVARHAGASEEQLRAGDVADVLWAHLSQLPSSWLLVVDNADDPALLDGPGRFGDGTGWVRPHAGLQGGILITSRDSSDTTWGEACVLHPVRPLSGAEIADATHILLDHAPGEAGMAMSARRLAERLGGLPLALRLAGTYLAEANEVPPAYRDSRMPTDFTSYQTALDANPRQVDPGNVIAQTWAMSLQLLERRGQFLARPLLELIATFADAPLPYTLLLTPETLVDAGELAVLDGLGLWRLLTSLSGVGLLDLSAPHTNAAGAMPTVRLHPLVRDTSKSDAAVASAVSVLHRAVCADGMAVPEDPAYWEHWRLLLPHALDLFHRATSAGLPDRVATAAARVAGMAARHLQTRGLSRQARAELETLRSFWRGLRGDAHPDALATRHSFAAVLHAQGEVGEAEKEFQEVLTTRCELLGSTHPDTLTTRHTLAWTWRAQGKLGPALQEFDEILALRRTLLGYTHRDTLATWHHLAVVLRMKSDLVRAQAELEDLLAVWRDVGGDAHPDTLVIRHEGAVVLHQLGELDRARAEFERVLELRRELLGDVHPYTLATRDKLAMVLRDMGSLTAARAELEAVLAFRREWVGDIHSDTLVARHNLATVLYAQGESGRAREEFENVLALRRAVLGEAHPATEETRAWLHRCDANPHR
ncbi:FxSxx-COOH system tetratricopeptide repeat protein [Streptomyces phaeochromogenes]|uniref:FxSxx-COOH system tetratricopeptide repeat protein n=1 Tax=Streptomyces phaeochromogenes TaxID=1923 RepID=UPI003864BFB5|nr:FxSxx-COOH system tetratricopeptide repeat protein [Streptomyces phaeochromogenes]